MNDLRSRLQGLWLPLVTPFRDGALDEVSLRRLLLNYTDRHLDGLILGATSGEGLSLSMAELERLVEVVNDALANARSSLSVCLGLRARARPRCRRSSTRRRLGLSTAI